MRKLFSIKLSDLKISTFVLILALGGMAVGMLAIAFSSLSLLKKSKFQDTWAISYLEIEHQVINIEKKLNNINRKINFYLDKNQIANFNETPQIILEVINKSTFNVISGIMNNEFNVLESGLNKVTDIETNTFLELNGKIFLAKRDNFKNQKNYKIYLWELNLASFFTNESFDHDLSHVYLTTLQGKVLYANDTDINTSNLLERPLVKKFIKSPLEKGQYQLKDQNLQINGFFAIVPHANLVLFTEIPNQLIADKVNSILKQFLLYAAIILLIVIIIIKFGMRKISRPIEDLIEVSKQIAKGQFKIDLGKIQSFGELNFLGHSIYEMAVNLEKRDIKILRLLEHEKEKIRLAKDLQIAQEIQKNFLPQPIHYKNSELQFTYIYKAAGEVAGDWVGFFENKNFNETIIAIADVSGHGAGSSMFTAITAGLFTEHMQKDQQFEHQHFISSLHNIVRQLGQGKWHITLQIYVFNHITRILDIYNCGHVFPFVFQTTNKKFDSLVMPSSPLCIDEQLNIFHKQYQQHDDVIFVLYTDGLTEATNSLNAPFKGSEVRKTIKKMKKFDTKSVISQLLQEWELWTNGQLQKDDVCVVSFYLKK